MILLNERKEKVVKPYDFNLNEFSLKIIKSEGSKVKNYIQFNSFLETYPSCVLLIKSGNDFFIGFTDDDSIQGVNRLTKSLRVGDAKFINFLTSHLESLGEDPYGIYTLQKSDIKYMDSELYKINIKELI